MEIKVSNNKKINHDELSCLRLVILLLEITNNVFTKHISYLFSYSNDIIFW